MPGVRIGIAAEVVDARQGCGPRQICAASYRFESVGAEGGDDARFQIALPRGRARQAQPWRGCPAAIALAQAVHQRFADAGELLHVLVAVHVVGWRAPGGFEGVELAVDLGARGGAVKAAEERAPHGLRQTHAVAAGLRERAGPVQVQTDVDASAQRGERRRVLGPTR